MLWRPGAKVIYTYDFGDNWEHAVVLEKILPPLADLKYPICIDGKLACPPEDCGGIPGYYDIIEAIADPGHDRHEEISEWMSDDFDPKAFSMDDVNRMLSPTLTPGTATKN